MSWQVTYWDKEAKQKRTSKWLNNTGKRTGRSELWYKNGNRKSIYRYDNGILNGEFTTWYNNEKIKTHGYYKDGKLTGEYTKRSKNGELKFFRKYGLENKNSSIPILVTSALPYVNNVPHLGNIIGSTLSGDICTRYHKMLNRKVLYLCGTDQYGTCTVIKAKQENLSCQEICDKYHEIHKKVYDWFNIQFDIFGKTPTTEQTELTHEIFLELYKNNYIEEKETEQLFCKTCDLFLADRYIKGLCYHKECYDKKVITNGDQCDICNNAIDSCLFETCWCTVCNSTPIKLKTTHLYLKLAKFKKQLKKYFISNKSTVNMTAPAFSITKSLLNKELKSRCITRDLKWGTPMMEHKDFPELKKFKDKVFYVWFDAPIGYLSILKHARPDDWLEWLKGKIICTIAKDNVPFHTIMYPATLMGTKFYKYLPTDINCTEYLNYEGKKFSKSNNVGIFGDTIMEISSKLEITEDYFRYYLIRTRPEIRDTSFSWQEFRAVVQAELVNKIGNLINRCFTLTKNNGNTNCDIKYDFKKMSDVTIFETIQQIVNNYHEFFENYKYKDAVGCIVKLAEFGNEVIHKYRVWDLLKISYENGLNLLECLNFIVCLIIKLLTPIIPRKCEQLSKNFICNIDLLNLRQNGTLQVIIQNYELPFKMIAKIDY